MPTYGKKCNMRSNKKFKILEYIKRMVKYLYSRCISTRKVYTISFRASRAAVLIFHELIRLRISTNAQILFYALPAR